MDYALKMKLIKKYSLKFFKELDVGVKNQDIIKYYKKKYNGPMHLITMVQHISEEKRPVEINEEIHAIPGVKIGNKYYSGYILQKLKLKFDPSIFPKANKFKRTHMLARKNTNRGKRHYTKKHPVTMYEGICINCMKHFIVNLQNHPTNLCGCLKCYPNGIGFHKTTNRLAVNNKKIRF